MRNDTDTIYLQPGAQVTVDCGEAGKLTIKTASPTWTTDKPTKEGWYWYRENGQAAVIVQCYSIDPIEGPMLWEFGLEQDFHGVNSPGEWFGPLEIPE